MTEHLEIQIAKTNYGLVPSAVSLNPCFDPAKPLFVATLDIRWEDKDPLTSIAHLEEELLRFSPSFTRHACRGDEAYHVFLKKRPETGKGERRRVREQGPPRMEFDGALALAHIVEHAAIDFQCAITGADRCSGVTGAHREPANRFDIFLECTDVRAGRCALVLALSWVASALSGGALGEFERGVLCAARMAYQRNGGLVTPPAIARELGWPQPRAERTLAALRDAGFLDENCYTMNFSGVPEYHSPAPKATVQH